MKCALLLAGKFLSSAHLLELWISADFISLVYIMYHHFFFFTSSFAGLSQSLWFYSPCKKAGLFRKIDQDLITLTWPCMVIFQSGSRGCCFLGDVNIYYSLLSQLATHPAAVV